jgi:serine/threonine protein kinase
MDKKKLLFLSPSVASGKERECVIQDFESVSKRALGEGAFGQVFKVRHIGTGSMYAIKMISKAKIFETGMLGHLRREIRIMYSLDHPYIIKLYNHFEDDKNFYLILQLAENGSLFDKLVKVRTFDEKTTAQYIREVALAIQYLHTREPPIIHRDIKPENIFLDKDGIAKLGDFGWSSFSDNARSTYCGTLEYLAPEMIDRRGHDTRLDLWNLGILLFELLTGNAPFRSNNQEELFVKIKSLKIGFPKNFPSGAKELVRSLLKAKPEERITLNELFEHPWMVQNPPLRKTCGPTTEIVKLPNESEIPEKEYKVISKPDNAQQLLQQEKILRTQLRIKIKKYENDLHQLQSYLKRLQDKELKISNENIGLQKIISELQVRVANDYLNDDENRLSSTQEDIDDKIVRVQLKLRKLEFEIRIKNKEAIEKRNILVNKEIKFGVMETYYSGLKSYAKEFKWVNNLSKSSIYLLEFKRILDMINDDAPDSLVKSYLDEIKEKVEVKPELTRTLEDLNEVFIQKTFTNKEMEESLQEIKNVSQLKSQVYQSIFSKKHK